MLEDSEVLRYVLGICAGIGGVALANFVLEDAKRGFKRDMGEED